MVKKICCVILACLFCLQLVSCGTKAPAVQEAEGGAIEEKQATATVFVDDENCKFEITGVDEDSFWGYTLKTNLENKTDKELMFSLDDVSVNGYMCDPFWATSVQGGKKSVSDINFMRTSLEEIGVEKVENIEFTLRVHDANDFMADSLVEETFTFTVK